MDTLKIILLILEITILSYFCFSALYFLVFSIAALFYKEIKNITFKHRYKVSILIPSYKEDRVIVETACSAMKHQSTRAEIDVYVIADSLKPKTLIDLKQTGVNIIPIYFAKSTKSKSINKSLQLISK